MTARWWEHQPKRECAACGGATYSRAAVPLHRHCRPRAAPRGTTSWSERRRRQRAVQAHREEYGPWCPGWRRAAHVVDETRNPLTADHIGSVAATGAEDGDLQVLCRSCNSSKREQSGYARPVEPGSPGQSAGGRTYTPSGTC